MIFSILVRIQIVKDKHVVILISSHVRQDLIATLLDSLAPANAKYAHQDHIALTMMVLEGVLLFNVLNITIVQRVIFMIISMNKGFHVRQEHSKLKVVFIRLRNVNHAQWGNIVRRVVRRIKIFVR